MSALLNFYGSAYGAERKTFSEKVSTRLNRCSLEDFLIFGGDFNCTECETATSCQIVVNPQETWLCWDPSCWFSYLVLIPGLWALTFLWTVFALVTLSSASFSRVPILEYKDMFSDPQPAMEKSSVFVPVVTHLCWSVFAICSPPLEYLSVTVCVETHLRWRAFGLSFIHPPLERFVLEINLYQSSAWCFAFGSSRSSRKSWKVRLWTWKHWVCPQKIENILKSASLKKWPERNFWVLKCKVHWTGHRFRTSWRWMPLPAFSSAWRCDMVRGS